MTTNVPALAGVIGSPISHSKSPKLYAFWLRELGITGFYVPLNVPPADLAEVLRVLPKMGFKGINVTLPHKEAILSFADRVSDRAALIGAANTITFQQDGTIHADNTDGVGFLENLRSGAPDWRPQDGPAVVLGAGGAARAVLASLLDAGVPEIRLANRTRVKAELLRDAFGPRIHVQDWNSAREVLGDINVLVNTTSLGMQGKPDLKLDLSGLSRDALVTDLVYAPLETDLLAGARSQGNLVVDGLGMLLHQAVPGFERWFGVRPDVTHALRMAALD